MAGVIARGIPLYQSGGPYNVRGWPYVGPDVHTAVHVGIRCAISFVVVHTMGVVYLILGLVVPYSTRCAVSCVLPFVVTDSMVCYPARGGRSHGGRGPLSLYHTVWLCRW